MKNYRSTEAILQSVYAFEQRHASGLNGFILLMHIGTANERTDKLFNRLQELLKYLHRKKYTPVRINNLLQK